MTGQVIRDRLEIVSTLRQLARERELLSAQWESSESAPVSRTTLLAVNPDYEELVFDCFADGQANDRALEAGQVNFLCHLDGVEIRFYASHGEAALYEGQPALRMRIPAQMLRLQRREFFRVRAAHSCDATLELDGRNLKEVRVGDLSLGGLTLFAHQPFDAKLGQVIEKCRLRLGDEGHLHAALEVCSVQTVPMLRGVTRIRVGCRFVSLAPDSEIQLARFIQQLERRAVR
jgi:c-di-GMP-binding flagellar brake protein YcgR